ncbi:MAG TPA: type II secretion system protein GspM [Thermohalobaculum sp.]|nr:type II secretion system protein GspM [Thermohalobaculum sp.]
MTEVPPIVGRILALALLLGLGVLVAVLGVLPFLDRVRTTDEALAFNREMVQRLSRSLADRGTYDAQIEALQARINESGLYIRADTEPLAAAAVQEQLKRAVGQYGGELRSVQSLSSTREDTLTRVGLRIVMTGGVGPLIRVLHQLETGEPYLFVDNLLIKTDTRRRRRNQDEVPDVLSIRFDVYGYLPPELEQ